MKCIKNNIGDILEALYILLLFIGGLILQYKLWEFGISTWEK
jgi:hypothetical protein